MKDSKKATGVEAIAAERRRQLEELQYKSDHDDLHTAGELAFAAAGYALPAGWTVELHPGGKANTSVIKNAVFPWKSRDLQMITREGSRSMKEFIKRRQDELVKAGALVAAEYDRLERMMERIEKAS